MDEKKPAYSTIDEYLSQYSPELVEKLQALRTTIRENAPDAEECISYGMPAFKLHGPLVYFAPFKKHIGFFPAGSEMPLFQERLAAYKTSKGGVQFPLDQPLPLALIADMVRFRVSENIANAGAKKKKK